LSQSVPSSIQIRNVQNLTFVRGRKLSQWILYRTSRCFQTAKVARLGLSGIDADWHRSPTRGAFKEGADEQKSIPKLAFRAESLKPAAFWILGIIIDSR
jgi:hypothetical protein